MVAGCHVPSPLKKVELEAVPDARRAVGTVPEFKLEALPAVKPAEFPVQDPEEPDVFPVTLPVTLPSTLATRVPVVIVRSPVAELVAVVVPTVN